MDNDANIGEPGPVWAHWRTFNDGSYRLPPEHQLQLAYYAGFKMGRVNSHQDQEIEQEIAALDRLLQSYTR